MNPSLSIILPAYNSAPYLDKCLQSVLNQTFKDFELICVNDGSSDDSSSVLHKYEALDSRIKVIDQENQGPALARNAGLEVAVGDYIGFMDSDDWIDPDYFESMYNVAVKTDADIVLNTHVMREDENGSHDYTDAIYTKQLPEGEFLDNIYASDYCVCLLYAHLYKHSLLKDNDVWFQKYVPTEGYYHEDEYFHRIAHYYARSVFAYQGPEYHYVKRPGSIMNTKRKKVLAYIRCMNDLRNRFGDSVYEPDFRLKLYMTPMFNGLSDDDELNCLKDYLLSLDEYFKKSGVYVSHFDHYVMDNILASSGCGDCLNRISRYPWVRYQTRIRLVGNKNPKVSVIIPVYNMEKYLSKCLSSVCNQNLRNIEIICVNDCSKDNSLDIIKRYSNEDIRIKIIDLKTNGGVSNARNVGLKAASGEYVFYMDSDDWLEKDYLAGMYETIVREGTDMIVNSNYVNEYLDDHPRAFSKFSFFNRSGEYVDSSLIQRLFPPVVWLRLYKRSFLLDNAFEFPLLNGQSEDIYFTSVTGMTNEKTYIFSGPLYHYLQRSGSGMRQAVIGYAYIQSFKLQYENLKSRGISQEGLRLYYVENLILETEKKYNETKAFMMEIKDMVLAHKEYYNYLDLFLLRIMEETDGFEDFKSRYNTNIPMSFIRERMKTS